MKKKIIIININVMIILERKKRSKKLYEKSLRKKENFEEIIGGPLKNLIGVLYFHYEIRSKFKSFENLNPKISFLKH